MGSLDRFVQGLLDVHDDPFVLIDRDCRIVAANRAYADAYAVSAESVVGRTCHEVSHHSASPCHRNGEVCPLQQVLATGEKCEVVHVHFDRHNCAERVRLAGYPVRAADGALYLGERITRLDCTASRETAAKMVGSAPPFLACLGHLAGAARTDAPVLLSGESGVGKELAARFLHDHSARSGMPFLALDCATFSQPLFESELFGHERGAFTGSVGRKGGLYELAHGGTLFLDEVGDMPHALQAKLLRVLESGEFRRVGGNDVQRADVRLVTASNRNLPALIDAGQFRPELYYRISGIEITLPPLRERRGDIPALAEALLDRLPSRHARRPRLTRAALERLAAHPFPGNIRELRNILLRAACLSGDKPIEARHIALAAPAARECAAARWPPHCAPAVAAADGAAAEVRRIAELLAQHGGHRATVARAMGITERTLYRKLKRIDAEGGKE